MSIAEQILRAREDYDAVYEAGYEKGKSEGGAYEQEVADGKQAEYDAFWDAFQDNGKRTAYSFGFRYWNDVILHPKYDIKPVGSNDSIFREVKGITDFEQWQKDCGIVVDFSEVTGMNDGFYNSSFERFGVLNFSKVSTMNFCFLLSKAKIIEKIKLPTDKKTTFNSAFNNASNLEEIRSEGLIANNGLNFQWATKLSRESIESIIYALSMDTSGLSITLSQAAVNKAFETSEGANDGSNSVEFADLCYERDNWTINLV